MASLAWMENWTHVGCGWRVFLRHASWNRETEIVAQGLNVLAATLLTRRLKAEADQWDGVTLEVWIPETVLEVLSDADAATHRELLVELAGGADDSPAAVEARLMLAAMRSHNV